MVQREEGGDLPPWQRVFSDGIAESQHPVLQRGSTNCQRSFAAAVQHKTSTVHLTPHPPYTRRYNCIQRAYTSHVP